MEADYVIVGAGAAGCVLAARLCEDPTISVLLLESGGRGRHLLLRIPKGFYLTMQHPEYAYFYPTGSVSPGGPDEVWLRGKGLGGSTAVNGMMYIRGWAADYDRLTAAGDPGWGWAGMLPVFRAMEDHQLGASLLRGVGGPLHVSITAVADPVVAAMLRSATAAGLADVDDFNASDAERIGRTPVTIHRGVRISAVTRLNSSGLISAKGAKIEVNAELTQMSMGPSSFSMRATAASIWTGSATSTRTTIGVAPATVTSAAAAASPTSPRANIAIESPRLANSRTTARPTPPLAPVTATTRPCTSPLLMPYAVPNAVSRNPYTQQHPEPGIS